MRSIPLMAATTVILTGAWACGGDGGTDITQNNPPAAIFTAPNCTTSAPCTFTDASTDQDGDALSRLWNFGDNATSTDQTVNHQFAEAKTYSVTLTVTDPDGASNSVTHDVVVTGGTTGNVAPTAGFVVPTTCTVNAACSFTDTSSDPDGSISSWSWDFNDGTALDGNQSPTHSFGAASTYQVKLTVTDNGGATNSITQAVTVNSAPQSGNCGVIGADVTCELSITQASTVTLTLSSRSCELAGNNVVIAQPYTQNVFSNTCFASQGTQYTLRDANGGTLVAQPGSLRVRLHQGTASVGNPTPGAPAGKLDGAFPNWTINFDDGGTPGIAGEPDFNDVVVSVKATPQ